MHVHNSSDVLNELNHSTHAHTAHFTISSVRQGPCREIASVLMSPITDSASDCNAAHAQRPHLLRRQLRREGHVALPPDRVRAPVDVALLHLNVNDDALRHWAHTWLRSISSTGCGRI
jgi:hypothetical protein